MTQGSKQQVLAKHSVDVETIFCGQRDEMAAAGISV